MFEPLSLKFFKSQESFRVVKFRDQKTQCKNFFDPLPLPLPPQKDISASKSAK